MNGSSSHKNEKKSIFLLTIFLLFFFSVLEFPIKTFSCPPSPSPQTLPPSRENFGRSKKYSFYRGVVLLSFSQTYAGMGTISTFICEPAAFSPPDAKNQGPKPFSKESKEMKWSNVARGYSNFRNNRKVWNPPTFAITNSLIAHAHTRTRTRVEAACMSKGHATSSVWWGVRNWFKPW